MSAVSVVGAKVFAAGDVASIPVPHLAYHALSPILIVLVAALVGVLVEAFAPREARYYLQVAVTLGGLVAALVAVGLLHNTSLLTAQNAIAVDGFTLFLQGTILVLAIFSVMLIAERSIDTGSAVVAQAAIVAGSRPTAASSPASGCRRRSSRSPSSPCRAC